MKLQKLAGATSEIWQVFVRDSSSTTGAGLTGLTNASASLTAYYHRDTDTTATVINLVTMTVGTFTSSGFKEIDATNMPGWYQFCPPNAALASGAKSCAIHLKGATNMAPLPIEVQLTAINPDSATAFITSVATVTTVTNQLTAAAIATGVWTDTTAGDFTTALSVGKSLMNGVSLGTGLTVNDLTTKTGFSLTQTFPTNFSALGISAGGHISTVDTLTTYTGNTVQTGDAYARVGAAGAGLTALGDARIANLDATVTSRMASYTQPTGFLTATFPSGTLTNTTNITAGTIDSVAGNVGGNVVGSVGSVASVTIKKNAALAAFPFTMTDSTNHAPAPGLAVSASRSLDGAAFAACANAVAEVGSGDYKISLAATDLNANTVMLRFTATAADDLNICVVTQP